MSIIFQEEDICKTLHTGSRGCKSFAILDDYGNSLTRQKNITL
jgi:hypothetical protein